MYKGLLTIIVMDIETIVKKNNLYYLKNLKNECIKQNFTNHNIDLTLEEINYTISEINSTSETETYTEDYIFKKDWNKLHNTLKIIKLKEFVNKLNIKKSEDKNKLKKQLTELVKSKKLTKKNTVNYNIEKGLISSIPDLIVQNNKYSINL